MMLSVSGLQVWAADTDFELAYSVLPDKAYETGDVFDTTILLTGTPTAPLQMVNVLLTVTTTTPGVDIDTAVTIEYYEDNPASPPEGYRTLPTVGGQCTFGPAGGWGPLSGPAAPYASINGDTTIKVTYNEACDISFSIVVVDGATQAHLSQPLETSGYVVDMTDYDAAVLAIVDDADEADYTTASWTDYKTALDSCDLTFTFTDLKATYEDSEGDIQTAVDDETTAINAAINLLVTTASISTGPYVAAVQAAADLTPADYTTPSWTAFQEAIADYIGLLAADGQDALDAAVTAITNAISQLEAIAVVNTDAYDTAEAAVEPDTAAAFYTTPSWDAYKAAIADYIGLSAADGQDALDAAVTALTDARDLLKLVGSVNTDDYDEAVAAIVADDDEANYTAVSWMDYKAALAACDRTLTAYAGQDALDAEAAAINAAIDLLVKVNTAIYDDLVSIVNNLVSTNYTTPSFADFQTAISSCRLDLTKADGQDALDAEVTAINAILNSLELVQNVDTTAYDEAVAAAKDLIEADYTAASWAVLDACDLELTAYAGQAALDAETTAINDAIAQLEAYVVDTTEYDAAVAAVVADDDEADYTTASWAAYKDALGLCDLELTVAAGQAALDAEAAKINAAIALLVELVDAELILYEDSVDLAYGGSFDARSYIDYSTSNDNGAAIDPADVSIDLGRLNNHVAGVYHVEYSYTGFNGDPVTATLTVTVLEKPKEGRPAGRGSSPSSPTPATGTTGTTDTTTPPTTPSVPGTINVNPIAHFISGYSEVKVELDANGQPVSKMVTTYKPDSAIKRAEVATIFYKLAINNAHAGNKGVTDLGNYGWAKDAVDFSLDQGIFALNSKGEFNPEGSLTRGELAMILAHVFGLTSKSEFGFSDRGLNNNMQEAIAAVNESGFMVGYGNGQFGANDVLTRAQLVTTICRVLNLDTSKFDATQTIPDCGPDHWAYKYMMTAAFGTN